MILKTLKATILALFTQPALADTLMIDDLPASLAAELASGVVQAAVVDGAFHSYASHAGFSAYALSRGGDPFVLVSYDALLGSQWSTNWSSIPLGGQVLVEVPSFHIPGTPAEFTLYLDQLMPGIAQQAFWSGQPQTSVVLQSDAMENGFGVAEFSGKYGNPPYTWSGNMSFATFDDQPFLCIECTFFGRLDLVFLDYSGVVLDFNFDDPRTTLFTGFDGFDYVPYGWGLDLVVNQVPLPAGLPLMLAALGSLGWLTRGRR